MKFGLLAFAAAAIPFNVASAQTITFAELQGAEIRATVVLQRQIRRDDEQHGQQARQEIFVGIGPGEKIRHTQVVNITEAKGSSSRSHSADFELGKPRNFRDGQAVWVFDNGELRRLRTLDTGGAMVVLSFAQNKDGLTCKISMPHAREQGGGRLRITSTNKGGAVEILSEREVSTACHIKRK